MSNHFSIKKTESTPLSQKRAPRINQNMILKTGLFHDFADILEEFHAFGCIFFSLSIESFSFSAVGLQQGFVTTFATDEFLEVARSCLDIPAERFFSSCSGVMEPERLRLL